MLHQQAVELWVDDCDFNPFRTISECSLAGVYGKYVLWQYQIILNVLNGLKLYEVTCRNANIW